MGFDDDMRIDPADGFARAVDLESADVRRRMDHLPLEIGQRYAIVIDHAQHADARSREILNERRAQTARPDDEHAGFRELLLARSANLRKDKMAGVTFDFFGGKAHVGSGVRAKSQR